jgi:hypothetical protein
MGIEIITRRWRGDFQTLFLEERLLVEQIYGESSLGVEREGRKDRAR